MLSRLEKPLQKNVIHRVQHVVQKLGDVQDLVSGKPVWQEEYRDAMAAVEAMYGANPERFDYAKAPDRGWQRGRRDFTDRVTYYRWHAFQSHEDGYGVVS